ncbi:hypothetical protein GCM10027088_08490 [Nocardia goodfellowii]
MNPPCGATGAGAAPAVPPATVRAATVIIDAAANSLILIVLYPFLTLFRQSALAWANTRHASVKLA